MDYLVSSTLVEGLQQPDPPQLPAKWYGNPHGYLKYLNGGRLPYFDRGNLFVIRMLCL